MEQNLRFVGAAPSQVFYRSQGLRGHTIDKIVYVLTALGGGALAWARKGFSLWDLASIPLVIASVWYVTHNEAQLLKRRGTGFKVM